MSNTRSFWTISELSDEARISPGLIRKLIGNGVLPSTRFGDCHRIPTASAELFLRQGTQRRQLHNEVRDVFNEAGKIR